MDAWVRGGQWKPFDHMSQALPHLSTEYLTSYRRVLQKEHATVLATGKNASLLGILDQIATEM